MKIRQAKKLNKLTIKQIKRLEQHNYEHHCTWCNCYYHKGENNYFDAEGVCDASCYNVLVGSPLDFLPSPKYYKSKNLIKWQIYNLIKLKKNSKAILSSSTNNRYLKSNLLLFNKHFVIKHLMNFNDSYNFDVMQVVIKVINYLNKKYNLLKQNEQSVVDKLNDKTQKLIKQQTLFYHNGLYFNLENNNGIFTLNNY